MNRQANLSATLACGLAGEVVRTFGEVRLRVFGTSMVPSILPGDLISVQRVDMSEISPGEIVLFSQQGRLFAHRAAGSAGSPDDPYLVTRGDRLCHNDPPVFSSELLGRVSSIERGHRQVQPATRLSGWEQMIIRLLQSSDRATYLYLRLAACWRDLFSGRAECRV